MWRAPPAGLDPEGAFAVGVPAGHPTAGVGRMAPSGACPGGRMATLTVRQVTFRQRVRAEGSTDAWASRRDTIRAAPGGARAGGGRRHAFRPPNLKTPGGGYDRFLIGRSALRGAAGNPTQASEGVSG